MVTVDETYVPITSGNNNYYNTIMHNNIIIMIVIHSNTELFYIDHVY